jgi:lanosterol synthase
MATSTSTSTTQTSGALKRNSAVTANGTRQPCLKETTDRSRWRLHNDRGCHIWHYLESDEECEKWKQTCADKWYLGIDTVGSPMMISLHVQCAGLIMPH